MLCSIEMIVVQYSFKISKIILIDNLIIDNLIEYSNIEINLFISMNKVIR